MAETVKGTVVVRSIPSKDVEQKVVLYLAAIYREVEPGRIASLLARTKPLAIVENVTRSRGEALAEAINGLGASAYFLQYLGGSSRH